MRFRATAILAAGGESRRMGFDKERIALPDGKPLVLDIVERLAGLFDETVVVTRHPELYSLSPCRVTSDLHEGGGALAALHAGCAVAASETAYFHACDMPLVDERFAALLMERLAENPGHAVVARYGQWFEPFAALYPVSAAGVMDALLLRGERGFKALLEAIPVAWIGEREILGIDPGRGMFANLNSPAELRAFLASLGPAPNKS